MERTVIIDFQKRIGEAESILEAANRREIARLEASRQETEQHLAEIRVQHSELLSFVQDLNQRMEDYVNSTMLYLIDRERERSKEYDRRLAELKETPPPQLIVSQ